MVQTAGDFNNVSKFIATSKGSSQQWNMNVLN